ncbi:MAG: plastocyanin/azurin family copper-binding protein [Candidatus Acidiferrales bacterium]
MNTVKGVVLMAVLFGATFVVGAAQAGDVKGKVSATGLKLAENIAVYIDAIPGKKFDAPAQHVSVDQRDLKFIPQTIVILRGTTVDFLNSDHVIHNVHWSSIGGDKRLAHSLSPVAPGQKQSFQFDNVGVATILCSFHLDMIGYVVIVPTPYFALTGYDGNFTIKDVPPGTYTLKTWSADGKPTTQSITVTDAPTNVDLAVVKK